MRPSTDLFRHVGRIYVDRERYLLDAAPANGTLLDMMTKYGVT